MLAFKIRLLSMQPSGQVPLDLRQQEKFSCFRDQCRRPATCHQPSASGVWYSSTRKTSTRSSTRHRGPIRSTSELSWSIYPRVKILLSRIAETVLTSTNRRMKSTLCRTVTSVQRLNIGRLSTPSDQRPAHLSVPMKDQKLCTSLR